MDAVFHRRFVRLPNASSLYDPYVHYPFGFSAGAGLGHPSVERSAAAFLGGVRLWCKEEFGAEYARWIQAGVTFRFQTSTDATAFFLRWG